VIKLKDAGELGGPLTLEMHIGDLLSLLHGIEQAVIHLEEREDAYKARCRAEGKPDDNLDFMPFSGFGRDQRANYRELARCLEDRAKQVQDPAPW
jgi:hypothetical protein